MLRKFINFLFDIKVVFAVQLTVLISFLSFTIPMSLGDTFQSTRLVGPFLLLSDETLYSTSTSGNWMVTLYGPMFFILLLPVVLFKDPISITLAGSLLCYFYLGSSIFYLKYVIFKCWKKSIFFTIIILLSFLYLSPLDSLIVNQILADNISIALILFACGFYINYTKNKSKSFLFYCLVLISLAFWTKQNTALSFLAFLFVLPKKNVKSNLYILVLFGLIFVIISLLFSLCFGFEEIWLNLFKIPLSHPVRIENGIYIYDKFERFSVYLFWITKIVTNYWFVFLSTLIMLYFLWRSKSFNMPFDKEIKLLLYLSICSFPLAVLGRAKVGGLENTLSLWMLPWLIASFIFLYVKLNSINKKYLIVFLFLFTLHPVNRLYSAYYCVKFNPIQQRFGSYKYIKNHPGTAYFPWAPLSHIQGENTYLPVSDILWSFKLANINIDRNKIAEKLPKSTNFVILNRLMMGRSAVKENFPTMKSSSHEIIGITEKKSWGYYPEYEIHKLR